MEKKIDVQYYRNLANHGKGFELTKAVHDLVDVVEDYFGEVKRLEADLSGKIKALNSAKTLITAMEGINSEYAKREEINREAVATLDSEREANAILTDEIARIDIVPDRDAQREIVLTVLKGRPRTNGRLVMPELANKIIEALYPE